MRPLRHYIKHSLVIHAVLIGLIAVSTMVGQNSAEKHMRFVILPKGTSLDAVITKDVVDAINNKTLTQASGMTSLNKVTPTPAEKTPEPEKKPSPTPIKIATPTPLMTPAVPSVPEKVITVAPKLTPQSSPVPTPTASPKPTATPRPTPVPTPKKTATPKPSPTAKTNKDNGPEAAVKTPNSKVAENTVKPTPKKKATPTPTPLVIASAYDVKPGTGSSKIDGANLPRQTPANATTQDALPGQEIGVTGVPEGVEGAPLPLDRNQSTLSMLYTTNAKMRIQKNFTVPPGVNDVNMTCVIEWEILPDGTIQNAKVSKSTGVAQYDSCALDAINKTANLGPLPPEFGKKPIWTSLTFVYAGDDGLAPPQ